MVFIKADVGACEAVQENAPLLQKLMTRIEETLSTHAGHLRQFIIDDKGQAHDHTTSSAQ